MKTVVLDSNELVRDWTCSGLKYQLLDHMFHAEWVEVCVPAVVFEEVVANHRRELHRVRSALSRSIKDLSRLGISAEVVEGHSKDYRDYLGERMSERLAISVLPWPEQPHETVAQRAIDRTPPFDNKGGGYRDTLIWCDVIGLVRSGRDVALVSADRAFADEGGALCKSLSDEVEELPGSVELVADFANWLIRELPWSVESLADAVAESRRSEVLDYYLHSDMQDDLSVEIVDLGLSRSPYSLELLDIAWDGNFEPVAATTLSGAYSLVEYDLGQTVEFVGEFPEGTVVEPGWMVSEPNLLRRISVSGTVEMVVRLAVLFDPEYGMTIDQTSWRRRDGKAKGAEPIGADPNQLRLWEVG